MEQNVKKNYNLLKFLYGFRYYGDALYSCFFQLFLVYKGLGEENIGIIYAITPIMILLVNPIWTYFSKNVNINRIFTMVFTIIEGVIVILFTQASGFVLLAILTGLISMLTTPFYNLLDGFTGTFCDQNRLDYPIIRAIGSLTFAVSCAFGGYIIEWFSFEVALIIAGIIFILCSLIIHFIKPIKLQSVVKEKRDFKGLIKNKWFIFYCLFYVLTVVVSIIGDNFMGVYFKTVKNMSSGSYGILYCVIVLVEVATIFITSKFFKNANKSVLLIIAGLCYAIKAFAIAFNLPMPLLIIGVCVRGIAWGLILEVNIKYLIELIGVKNLTAGVLILASLQAVVQACFSIFGGKLIESVGYTPFYSLIGILCILATCFMIIISLIRKKSEKIIQNTPKIDIL